MSSSLNREYLEAIRAVLAENGVVDYVITHGGKHKKLRFTWQGREISYSFSATPSDSARGANIAVSRLRRVMGVKRVITEKAAPRKRKARSSVPHEVRVIPREPIKEAYPWEELTALVAASPPPVFDTAKIAERFAELMPPKPTLWQRLKKWWSTCRV